MISGCLNDSTKLEYRVEFPIDDGIFFEIVVDLYAQLPIKSELQDPDWEVTITPFLPDLQLYGTPMSTNLNEGKFVYVL